MIELLKAKYKELYSGDPIIVRAPGRINLIGEHTDYNDGFVFPAAIDKEILFLVAPNDSEYSRFYSFDFDQKIEINTNNLKKSEVEWSNYLLGVIDVLTKAGKKISGVNCVFGGNIPIGSGMSSSAALECGFIYALNELFELGLTKMEMVKLAQSAENNFVGVNCGIMDQFASMMGQKNHFLMLDCRSLEYKNISGDLGNYQIVLVNSMVKHSLASSEYNTRRKECESGVEIISHNTSCINSLRDTNEAIVNQYLCNNNDENVYKRCLYVCQENERVSKSISVLESGAIENLGELINLSHQGLSKLYEVSCEELDFLAQNAQSLDYVLGARMMGGGFGGCTLNLVERSKVVEFKNFMAKTYKQQFGIEPEFYAVEIVDGVSYY